MAVKIKPPASVLAKEGADQSMRELEELTAEPQELEVEGRTIKVGKLKIKQIGPLMAAIKDMLPTVLDSLKMSGQINVSALVEAGWADQLIRAVCITTEQDEKFIGDLPLDDFAMIAGKVFVVNMDFFSHRLPEVGKLVGAAIRHQNPAAPVTSAGAESSSV